MKGIWPSRGAAAALASAVPTGPMRGPIYRFMCAALGLLAHQGFADMHGNSPDDMA